MIRIETEVLGDVTVLKVFGKVTIGRGDLALRDDLDGLFGKEAKKVLLDLRETTYMDNAGIGQLVASSKHARDNRVMMKLLIAPGRVADLLHLTKLDEFIDTYADWNEAIASFS